MLSTSTPRSWATLFRLKSFVTILPCETAGQLDQLQIDFAHFREVDIRDDRFDARHLLNLLQDVEAASAAVPLERIRGVCDQLQFLQDELRDDQRSVDEARFADVRDAAVDDDAGVEDLVAPLRPCRPEQRHEPGRFEPLALAPADEETEIRQNEQNQRVQERDA